MRLDDEEASTHIEDRRGESGGFGGFGGGGFPIPLSGGSALGFVAIVVVSALLGVNPLHMLAPSADTGGTPQATSEAEQHNFDRLARVLGSTERIWNGLFAAQGARYEPPTLVTYRQSTSTGCGRGQAAVGPFYCPADRKVYIDLGFLDTLATRFGAPGDFAQAYVLAHEVGHHIQTITGIEEKVRRAQRSGHSNALQVRMELQADCFAGLWAHHADNILEPGDLEEGLRAAFAVGDDTLQKEAQGYVVPDSFTHGSSQQRMQWFKIGFEQGTIAACDTFSARIDDAR